MTGKCAPGKSNECSTDRSCKRDRGLACCRFRGHRDKVFDGTGGWNAETEVQPRVQARGGPAGEGSGRERGPGRPGPRCPRERASQMGERSGADPQQAFPGHGQMKPEQLEIDRLRREVAKLKAERDILKKAAAFFAREAR